MEILFAILENSRGWNAMALALGSFVLYVAAANLAWQIANAPTSAAAQHLRSLAARRGALALYQSARLAYYIGIPFVALYFGWIDLRAFGLGVQDLDWADGTRWAIVILLAAWLLLMLIWFPYLRATLAVPATPETQHTFARRLVELIYMQAHWAFYRAAVIVLLTGMLPNPLYWGAAVGLGLILLEAFLNPRVRARLGRVGEADALVWGMGQAFINALAFLVTRNLMLLALIHFLLELTVPHLRPMREPQRAAVPPPSAVRRATSVRE